MRCAASLVALAALPMIALAGETVDPVEHVDALVILDTEGRLVTGLVDFDTEVPLSDTTRVYSGAFGVFDIGGGSQTATTDVPGFFALRPSSPNIPAGFSALPPSTDLLFTAGVIEIDGASSNFLHWDGTGPVSFAAAPIAGNISKPPSFLFNIDLNTTASSAPGFTIQRTTSQGGLHQHLNFNIFDAQLAPDGVYLWSMTLHLGTLDSDPIYFVHTLGDIDAATHQQAIDYVRDTLVDTSTTLCTADLDGDLAVNLEDFSIFIAQFGNGVADCGSGCTADLDGNDAVNLDDFSIFIAQFGNTAAQCAG